MDVYIDTGDGTFSFTRIHSCSSRETGELEQTSRRTPCYEEGEVLGTWAPRRWQELYSRERKMWVRHLMLLNEKEATSYVVRNLGEKKRCLECFFFNKVFMCCIRSIKSTGKCGVIFLGWKNGSVLVAVSPVRGTLTERFGICGIMRSLEKEPLHTSGFTWSHEYRGDGFL